MSVGAARFSRERPTVAECLFCEKPGNLVIEPDEEAYHAIKHVADERQDATRDKFYFLYDDSLSRQCFSWHVKCATAYVCFYDPNRRARPLIIPKQEIKKEEPDEEEEDDVQIVGVYQGQQLPYTQGRSVSPEITRCLICDKELNLEESVSTSTDSRLSAAKCIYDTAHMNHDGVFVRIRRYYKPEDMIYKGMVYHKACYDNYVRPPRRPEKLRPGEISQRSMFKGLKKLVDEIDDKLLTGCFRLSYLAKRMAELTEVEGAVVQPETVKSLLIANYGEKLLFSYPAGVDSCVVFRSRVPLNEVMKRLR